jgi:hypothetical protein
MNSACGAFGRRSACADREGVFCVGGGRRLARRALRPISIGRGGLRPMVGLCRPRGCLLRRRRPTPGAQRLWKADFNRRGGLRPAVGLRRPKGWSLRRRRPTPGAERLGRPISIGVEAFGRWSACADRRGLLRRRRPTPGAQRLEGRFQSAWRPSAGGRPAPTGRVSFALAEADAWRAAPWKADFNRRGGLRPMVGLRRPGGGLLRRRRPTPGAQAPLEGRFQSAWRPSAGGRPAPTGRGSFASAEADAWRGALIRARADRRFRYSCPDSQMVSVSCNGGFGQVMIEVIIPRGIDDHRWGHGSS